MISVAMCRCLVLAAASAFLFNFCSCQDTETAVKVLRRFEYKLSFKGPHLVQPDGTIPFWDHFGDAIASDESVRITPSLKSKTGSVWSRFLNTNANWEVEIVFRVNGRGRVGADGLALWFTEERGQDGPVFGGKDQWKGLGVFFDSYDNDQMNNNPYIMIIVNDGTQQYNHDRDGADQVSGGCVRDFRNKPYPTRAKIEYYNRALTIYYHNGVTSNKEDFEICARVENIDLPKLGYFGVSAATGGLADDHDVLAFLTHSLISPTEEKDVSNEERKKFEQEFHEYEEKLNKAKEDYRKDHPSKPGEYVDEEKMFEAPEMREMKMILDGQSEIFSLVKSLVNKLDEVVSRQERQLSLMTNMNQQQGQISGSNQPNAIEKHEVNGLLSGQKEVVDHIRDIRSVIDDVKTRVSFLDQGMARTDGEANVLHNLKELQGYMSLVHNDVKLLAASSQTAEKLPCAERQCVTTLYLFVFLAIQLICIIAYMFYRARRDAASKKLF